MTSYAAVTLRGSTPWRRPGGPAAPTTSTLNPEAVDAFARRVLGSLGSPVQIGDRAVAAAAAYADLGVIGDDTFTGFPEEAATWSQLATGERTLDKLGNKAI